MINLLYLEKEVLQGFSEKKITLIIKIYFHPNEHKKYYLLDNIKRTLLSLDSTASVSILMAL